MKKQFDWGQASETSPRSVREIQGRDHERPSALFRESSEDFRDVLEDRLVLSTQSGGNVFDRLTMPSRLALRRNREHRNSPRVRSEIRRLIVYSAIQRSALSQLFNEARTYNEWSEKPVDEQTMRDLYDLLKWGPTSANSSPARFVWVRSAEGKAKLAALAMDQNRPKILAAPVTVIIGHDLAFPDTMPKLFPAQGEAMRQMFYNRGSLK
jgi:Nitroreductase family